MSVKRVRAKSNNKKDKRTEDADEVEEVKDTPVIDLNSSMWLSIMEKYKNSVMQLVCVRAVYSTFRPQRTPGDSTVSGTGFIVDINRGLVITNAHVVADAISISGKLSKYGEREFSVKNISICREKDIALCQINPDDVAIILQGLTPSDINMNFGDNTLLKETSPVIAIGFPLGQRNIKFTTGVVSGFHSDVNSDDDDEYGFETEEESPSYIQITAPINPGNSGGPLLNSKGEVIGVNAAGYMFSQNIAYAIPSRTVLSIYDELCKPLNKKSSENQHIPYRIITPKYAFEYNRASPDLLYLTCGDPNVEGVYIKNVYPNSVFAKLQEGDVISSIIFEDIYTNNPSAFNVTNRDTQTSQKGNIVVANIDKFGDITLSDASCGGQLCRKKPIKELFDMIPINTNIKIQIYRDQQGYEINSVFKFVPSDIRYYVYPRITPYRYEVIAGLLIGDLTYQHIALFGGKLKKYGKGKKRYEPRLVIDQVFPDTLAYHTKVFEEGTIIESMNGYLIRTIDDLRYVIDELNLSSNDQFISITDEDNAKFVISKDRAIKEDLAALKQFEITNYEYLLK